MSTVGATSEVLAAIDRARLLGDADRLRAGRLFAGRSDEEGVQRLAAAGLLTPFQARELLEGRGRRLRIEQYVIRRLLGLGGMGTVYEARADGQDNIVALKVLSEQFKHDAGMRARFRLEARIGMAASHPNLVRTLQLGETDDVFGEVDFVVMEFFPGIAVHELVQLVGPLAWETACDVICQAAAALHYLHRQGMVHRDVKPDNLLLARSGEAKLVDFGLSYLGTRLCEEEFSLAMIFGHDCLGTADYMPPEQADDSLKADARSDIYALGATLYTALCGRRPYQQRSRRELIEAHRHAPVPSVCVELPDAPPIVDSIIGRMMAKRPQDRFQSMAEVIQALKPSARRREVDFDFERLLTLRSRAAAKKLRGLTRSTSVRGSGPQGSSSIAGYSPTAPPVETGVDRPQRSGRKRAAATTDRDASAVAGQLAQQLGEQPAEQPEVRRRMAILTLSDGTTIPLVRSGYSLGRGVGNDIHLDSADLSMRHCQLSFDGQRWWISDLQSKNGVRVNGKAVTDHPLRSGDNVRLAGSVSFTIRYGSSRTWRVLAFVAAVAAAIAASWWWLL